MNKKPSAIKSFGLAIALAIPGAFQATAQAATYTITVNSGTSTGAIKYGGIGWLYGLDNNGYIPDSKITALVHPGYSGQMAPHGTQHAGGDALLTAPQAKRVGMPGVDIYVQDYYSAWPYPNNGVNSYITNVVRPVVDYVKADPNRSFFRYVPFNEPDWIWYAFSGTKFTQFLNDWKTVYNEIKTRDGASAKIIGPNWENYNASAMDAFMSFCKTNNVLPDVVSWHSLNDDFFTDWYNDYSNYRSIETKYGISAREVFINEYGRTSDLPVPGKLIQYLARYEKSKVWAALAFWSWEGTLSQLLTRTDSSETGAYWMYQWYGQMTGNTVDVALPSATGPLQAIASSSAANTVKVIFGGSAGDNDVNTVNVAVKGLSSGTVNYEIYETNSTTVFQAKPGIRASGTATVSGGQATIAVTNAKALSAYLVVVTPGAGGSTNLAQGKTATADSVQSGNAVASGNDGNTSTRWCANDGAVNHWWKVDLGSSRSLTGSEVFWEKSGIAYKYKVEVSNDNTNWTMAADRTTNTNTSQTQTQTFTANARYVRITVTGLSSSPVAWASFFEFRVFGT